jgi:hypothetical protein
LTAIGIAGLVALAIVPASAAAATVTDDDFAGSTPGSATWVVEPGSVRLLPTGLSANFDTLPAGWTATPGATVAGGSLTIDAARAESNTTFTPGQVLEFRASFGADRFQHVGFVADFDTGPWAVVSTGSGGGALFARTLGPGGDTGDQIDPAGFDPTEPHVYRIAWTSTGVHFSVEGTPWETLQQPLSQSMEIAASDFDALGSVIKLDWMALGPYGTSGTFESRVFDAGDTRAVWGSLTKTGSAAGIEIDTRTSRDGTTFSDWAPIGGGGAIASPPGQFLQYRARLSTSDPQQTPSLDKVEISYDLDTVLPTATIGDVQVSGSTATASFTSPDADLARFECRLDSAAYATCTSPKQFSGLAPASHKLSVRAVDTAGNRGDPAETVLFVLSAPPAGDPTPPPSSGGGGPAPDTTAPKIALGSRTLRVSKAGKVGVKLSCPAGEARCNVTVQLRLGRSTLARRSATISGGRSATVSLTLSKATRKRLAKDKKLKVSAVIAATDAAGNRSNATTSVTLRS